MHKEFTKFLRIDGMGIDYNKINFTYTEWTIKVREQNERESKELMAMYSEKGSISLKSST